MSDEAKYLVKKDGYFYRPNAQGYTQFKFDAGRYTKAEAEAHAAVEPWHMSAVHEDDVPDEREPDKFISWLHVEISELKRQLATAQKVDEQQTADFIEQRAAISRLGYQIEEFVGCLEEYVAMPASSLLTRLIGSASDATRVLAEIRGPSKPSEN